MGNEILYLSFLLGISLAYSATSEYTFYIVSSNNTQVIGQDNIPGKAVEIYDDNSDWKSMKAIISEAAWIWDKKIDSHPSQTCYFTENFFVTGVPIVANLTVVSDDTFEVFVNGIDSNCAGTFPNVYTCDIVSFLIPKENELSITAKNLKSTPSASNPAGLRFKLKLIQQIKIRDSLA